MMSCESCIFRADGSCRYQSGFCHNYLNQYEENEDTYIERSIDSGRWNFYNEFYEYLVENNGTQDLFY